MVGERATSLKRGVAILLALGSEEAIDRGGLGVVRISELVGQDKSQISRALAALAVSGMVDRDPDTRAYRLGWKLYTLAQRSGRPRLVALAPRTLSALVAELGETAHLSVLQGGMVLTLLSQAPTAAISARGWSGRTVPVACTSAGRALLFDHDLTTLAGDARRREGSSPSPSRPERRGRAVPPDQEWDATRLRPRSTRSSSRAS